MRNVGRRRVALRCPVQRLEVRIDSVRNGGMKVKAIIHQAEEGGYWAEVPALPGCVTQGETAEEVTSNLREAVEGWLSVETQETAVTQSDQIIKLAL